MRSRTRGLCAAGLLALSMVLLVGCKASKAWIIDTVAGTGTHGDTGDGGPATDAKLGTVLGLAFSPTGDLYLADDTRVRKIDAGGTISTVAGTLTAGYSGDGGPATAAQLGCLTGGLAFDADGNLYLADFGNKVVRKVDTSGAITTVAGNGTEGYSGDGGPATAAALWDPKGVAVDGAGNLYIACGNGVVRKVDPSGTISTFAGTDASATRATVAQQLTRKVDDRTTSQSTPTETSTSPTATTTSSARSTPAASSPPSPATQVLRLRRRRRPGHLRHALGPLRPRVRCEGQPVHRRHERRRRPQGRHQRHHQHLRRHRYLRELLGRGWTAHRRDASLPMRRGVRLGRQRLHRGRGELSRAARARSRAAPSTGPSPTAARASPAPPSSSTPATTSAHRSPPRRPTPTATTASRSCPVPTTSTSSPHRAT